jgi:hypothetical protein
MKYNKKDRKAITRWVQEYKRKTGRKISGDKRSNEYRNMVASMIFTEVKNSFKQVS